MSTLFSGHYLRNRSTLDIGVLGYIGIVNIRNTLPKFGPFLLWHPVYICMYVCMYVYIYIYIYIYIYTHTHYIFCINVLRTFTLTGFPRQKWLLESALMVHYTYIACLVFKCETNVLNLKKSFYSETTVSSCKPAWHHTPDISVFFVHCHEHIRCCLQSYTRNPVKHISICSLSAYI